MNKIAIIGGGPGGLLLGLLLQKQGRDFTIFEKAVTDENKSRGGSLDIHHDSGQIALESAGLLETFKSIARYEGEDFKLTDKEGNVLFEEQSEGIGTRPEIDRGILCDMIMEQLNTEHLRYGYALQRLEETGDAVKLIFDNGEAELFDIVIGSDGAFSKVRNHLSDTALEYSGISMIELNIPDVELKHPDLFEFNQRGKVFALDEEKGLLAQLNGNGSIKVYASYKTPFETIDQFKNLADDEAQRTVSEQFKHWHADLQKYIDYADDSVLYRRIYMLPLDFKWPHHSRITLIGDAAHLMSPFAGEGVNLALYDAYHLADALNKHEDIDDALQHYENTMYSYSSESAHESYNNLELMFSPSAAVKLADLMKQFHQ